MKLKKKLDPATHSGSLHASLTESARGLSVGEATGLADGSHIKAVKARGRSERWFMANGHGPTDSSTHRKANDAATKCLDYSAKSGHPKSVGGTHAYPDYKTYRETTG